MSCLLDYVEFKFDIYINMGIFFTYPTINPDHDGS